MGLVPKLDMEDSYVLITALRLGQLAFTGVVTGLTAALISNTFQFGGVPASVTSTQNFLMFCAVINWLSAGYGLVSRYIESVAIPIVQLPLDAAGTLFALIGAILISAKLGVVDCAKVLNRDNPYNLPEDWLAAFPKTLSESAVKGKCRMFQADDVFMYVLFATAAASCFFTFKAWKSGGGGRRSGGAGGIV